MRLLLDVSGMTDPHRPKASVRDIAESGFLDASLDLSLLCPPGTLEEAFGTEKISRKKREICPNRWDAQAMEIVAKPEKLQEYARPILGALRDCGVQPAFMRAPCLALDTKLTNLSPLLLQLARESIFLCKAVGCSHLVVPPLFSGIERGEEWNANQSFYLSLLPLAQACGVTILLENQFRVFRGRAMRGPLSNPTQMAEWIDRLNDKAGEERFGLCLNVAVCSACKQDLREYIVVLDSRIKAIQANGGDSRSLFCALREIGFDGTLIFYNGGEISTTIRTPLLRLIHEIAEYFVWQINLERTLQKYSSIVLFGAGNMLRNYMYCYGAQYPPLFACDNNPSHWGHEIHGVTVYPPEKLLELSPDCGIFICNMYYREIEKQLKAMGIKQIERFSDEYLPRYPLE